MDETVVRAFFEVGQVDSAQAASMLQENPALVDQCLDSLPLLHLAALEGHFGLVGVLLASGADVRRKDGGGDEALHNAIYVDRADMVRTLLSAGADPNEPSGGGYPPLHMAIERGMKDVAKLLLKYGARADYKSDCLDTIEKALKECPERDWFERLLSAYGWPEARP